MSPAPWPKRPVIHEMNTWVWLYELGQRYGRHVTLGDVPDEAWDAVTAPGADGVWLMGVWERSPQGVAIARANEGLVADFRQVLPDYTDDDVVGSAYCVRRYSAAPELGGPEGLRAAREALARRGVRLILDFVPNHVALDHPWAEEHPEYFIRGSDEDLQRDGGSFFRARGQVLALGRDPYFPAWPEVAQLNAFDPGLRGAVRSLVRDLAGQCDGVRCDMAMLVTNAVFQRTWGNRAGPAPAEDYWPGLIGEVKRQHPDFLFIAEAYWDMEWELQQQGFDFCYDKTLYDRLAHDEADSVRGHLHAAMDYQDGMIRFIENHDEPRAAVAFEPDRARIAAAITFSLPGAKLLHQGQREGKRIRIPVFLRRGPDEPPDPALGAFYHRLLRETAEPPFKAGTWQLLDCTGWPDNQTVRHIIAWAMSVPDEHYLVVANFSPERAQARVQFPWDDLANDAWELDDRVHDIVYERPTGDLRGSGLYVDLPAWGFHLFRCAPARTRRTVAAGAADR